MAKQINDPGFGEKLGAAGRIVNPDGTSNVRRFGERFHPADIYHYLITVSWTKFFIVTLLSYAGVNFFFAALYIAIGADNIQNFDATSPLSAIGSAIFFSAQTLTTVGYGHLAPKGIVANSLAAVESLVGLILFGVITGISVGRFTQIKPRILYAHNVIIAPHHNNVNALMLRMVNERNSVVMDMTASLTLVLQDTTEAKNRHYFTLPLEVPKIRSMPLNWTIVHPITPDSPLWGLQQKDLTERNAELLCIVFAFDDTVRQEFYSRVSYINSDFLWGKRFDKMFWPDEHGDLELHINRVHNVVDAELHPWNANIPSEITEDEFL